MNKKKRMDPTAQNAALARSIYDSFTAGNLPKILGMLAPGVRWCVPDMPNVPYAGCREGGKAVEEFFQQLLGSQEILEFSLERVCADAEKAAGIGSYRWKVRATGREFRLEWIHLFTISKGKITEFKEYYDPRPIIAAFSPQ